MTVSVRVELTTPVVSMLEDLAGGQRKKSEYLERVIPLMHAAQKRLEAAVAQAEQNAISAALVHDLLDQKVKA